MTPVITIFAVQIKAFQFYDKDVPQDTTGTNLWFTTQKVRSQKINVDELILCLCSYRLLVLPAPIKRDGEGQEVRRYLAYITTDKVQHVHFMP